MTEYIDTARLRLRLPTEGDRGRFVELFTDGEFMVFSGACTDGEAQARFDQMLLNAADVPFAKQPVIELASQELLGYCGVAWFDFEGKPSLEFGYRLTEEARGRGYATEAGLAMLELARQSFQGTLYAMIDPTNDPSMRVIDKLGFTYWKTIEIDDYVDRLYRIGLP